MLVYSKNSYQELKNFLKNKGYKITSFIKYIDKIEKKMTIMIIIMI